MRSHYKTSERLAARQKGQTGATTGQQTPSTTSFTPKRIQAGQYFCPDCQQARSDPSYHKRILDLMQPLHCGGCGTKHAAFLFSSKQRRSDASARQCIGLEGHTLLCDHYKANWVDDIAKAPEKAKGWAKTDTGVDESIRRGIVHFNCQKCDDAEAECTAEFNFSIRMPDGEWTANSRMRIKPQEDRQPGETGQQAYARQILECLQSCASVSCPHFRKTPYRIRDFDSHHKEGESFYMYFCQACPFKIGIQLPDSKTGAEPYIELSNVVRAAPNEGPASESWLQALHPDSYDHFDDAGTKHITWCDDRQCASTYELTRATSLRWLHENQEILRSLRTDEALDQITKRRINAACLPRPQQYLY